MKISFEITKHKIAKITNFVIIFIAGACIGIAMTEYKLSYSFNKAMIDKKLPTLAQLRKYSPNTTIDNYTFSKIPNFVAIQSGQKVFYMSNNGQYVLIGALYDIKNRVGITSEELNNFNTNPIFKHKKAIEPHMTWGSWNKKGEIIFNQGAKYKIAVFGDLHCPYCQRLETMLDKLKDVEIHYIPVVIHEDAPLEQGGALHNLISLREYNDENELFYNDNSIGFMLEVAPLMGASEDTINQITGVLGSTIKDDIYIQFLHLSSPRVGDLLHTWANARTQNPNNQGTMYPKLAEDRLKFLKRGAWG